MVPGLSVVHAAATKYVYWHGHCWCLSIHLPPLVSELLLPELRIALECHHPSHGLSGTAEDAGGSQAVEALPTCSLVELFWVVSFHFTNPTEEVPLLPGVGPTIQLLFNNIDGSAVACLFPRGIWTADSTKEWTTKEELQVLTCQANYWKCALAPVARMRQLLQ